MLLACTSKIADREIAILAKINNIQFQCNVDGCDSLLLLLLLLSYNAITHKSSSLALGRHADRCK